MKRAVREWIKKAEADHRAVERLGNDPLLREVVCFHCQQAAEKYLKAALGAGLLTPPTGPTVGLLVASRTTARVSTYEEETCGRGYWRRQKIRAEHERWWLTFRISAATTS
jgi:HEPN domain-containing protein